MKDTVKPSVANDTPELDEVTIKFAGDSGDGIQLAGRQFARVSSVAGGYVKTRPDFPAEIRAPVGTLAGVSGLQIRTGKQRLHTAGEQLDVLVVMNPAALKVNRDDLAVNGILIANADSFKGANLDKAGYQLNPLEDGSLAGLRVFAVRITTLTRGALKGLPLGRKQMDRCKNFFALGLICWLFHRPLESVQAWVEGKFGAVPDLLEANLRALQSGWNYGETSQSFATSYHMQSVAEAVDDAEPMTGNAAIVLGLRHAARGAGLRLFMGGYPITPATEILQQLSACRQHDVVVFQAEDELAAIGAAVGAAFAGALAVTATSGPGMALKAEFTNLAVMTELPLLIFNVQRGGPSTGLPTKSEQGDLLQALFGRNGESPLVVLAAQSPRDCYHITREAARIAVKYMTPVIVLSDLTLASGAESWVAPAEPEPGQPGFAKDAKGFAPYAREAVTLARPWAIPGTPGLEHILGGLEKSDGAGTVSYDPANHEKMVRLRAQKIAGVARDIPPLTVHGDAHSDTLLVGWGSTHGPIMEAVEALAKDRVGVAALSLRHLNPLPRELGDILRRYQKVWVVENNLGQLCRLLRAEYLLDLKPLCKVTGLPFKASEIVAAITADTGATV